MVKVTVVVPIYNGEKYIEDCIKMIMSQTLKDIEIILINDGSEDSSGYICDFYAKLDCRIIVVHQDNKGVSISRNKGIQLAKGQYICFVDCDDKINNNYLEELYNLIIQKKVELICCDIECVDNNGKYISNKAMQEGNYTNIEMLEELFKFRNLNWGPCGKLFKSSLVKDKIEFPNLHVYEDLSFIYKYLYNTNKVFFTNKCKYYYIQHENDGAMCNFIKSPTTDVIIVADEIIQFLKYNLESIFDTSFYGIISQVIMYISDINNIDKEWKKESSKIYLNETKKLLSKYRLDLIKNKTIYYKEKILFLILSFSIKLYKILT